MNAIKFSRVIFAISGIYDSFLGIVFLLFPLLAFDLFQVTYPNHLGYVQFPAVLLIVFAVMFFNIAKDPVGNVSFMPYGILLKVAYSGIVFWYWFFSDIPDMWKPFAIADLLFMFSFGWCYYRIRSFRSSVN